MPLNDTNGSIQLNTSVPLGTSGSLGNAGISLNSPINILGGTGTGKADTAYADALTITTSATNLDLNGGTLRQLNGAIASFSSIKLLRIRYVSGTGVLTIGGGTNAVADVAGTLKKPGAEFILYDADTGWTVTASTADILKLISSSGSIVVDIVILGLA